MKEHFQDHGIRKWAGNDLIELQSEPLEALQTLVAPYAPCILQGCRVKENDDGTLTVEPGLVALLGKDVKGVDCVKIVRFAGIANEKPPVYLTLACEIESRVYSDSKSKAIAYNYKAVATAQKPESPYLEIKATGGKRLVDMLGITQKLDQENAQRGVVTFTKDTAEKRSNVTSGSTLGNLFGKIERWLADLGSLAFKDKVAKSDLAFNFDDELGKKVDKVDGKGLSANDFTDKEKAKLKDIEEGAQMNVQSDWKVTDTNNDAYIKNKPSLATASAAGLMSKDDKAKLDGIAAGATKNIVDVGLNSLSTNSVQNKAVCAALSKKADSGHSHSEASTSAAGFMSAADKSKLEHLIAVAKISSTGNVRNIIGNVDVVAHSSDGLYRLKVTGYTTNCVPLFTAYKRNVYASMMANLEDGLWVQLADPATSLLTSCDFSIVIFK